MKIDFDITIENLYGQNVKDADTNEDITLGKACVTALTIVLQDEKISGDEKFKRYMLATKIVEGGEIIITTEEIVMLKDLIGKVYGPTIVGPVYMQLEGMDREEEEVD